MADTMVERITGQVTAGAVNVEIGLVMAETTLLGADDFPTHVTDYGSVPASVARQIAREADRVWLRRLFTSPANGSLVAMDSRRRTFDGELRRFLVLRDESCRTSWCDAPVRHADHIVRAADGGATSGDNAQGLCEACNYAKEAHGWKATKVAGGRHRVEVITPTGHRYLSTAPDPPGTRRPGLDLAHLFPSTPSPLEERLHQLVAA
jgi:hypothetical protein